MSQLTPPLPVLSFASFLYHEDFHDENELKELWKERFGEFFTLHHPYYPMREYYSKEMGDQEKLRRFFLFATQTSNRDCLVDDKLWADDYEQSQAQEGKRTVNIDPGYVSLENVVLATGKNYSHRISLRDGVYAELTLIFKQPSFVVTDWTYPDYSHPQVIEFFNWIRAFLLIQCKNSLT